MRLDNCWDNIKYNFIKDIETFIEISVLSSETQFKQISLRFLRLIRKIIETKVRCINDNFSKKYPAVVI